MGHNSISASTSRPLSNLTPTVGQFMVDSFDAGNWTEHRTPMVDERHNKPMAIAASDALHALRHDRALTRAALKIPFPIVYFIIYVLMLVTHIPASSLFDQTNALYTNLATKGSTTVTEQTPMQFFNIQTLEDVYDWLENTLVPTVFVSTDIAGSYLEEEVYHGRIAMYNEVIGNMLITTTRSTSVACNNQDFLNKLYPKCHDRDATTSDYFLYSAEQSASVIADDIKEKKNASWISNMTTEFSVDIVTYNGEMDAYGVTSLKFEFQQGGFIDLSATTISSKASAYSSTQPYVMDGLVGLCFLFVLSRQLRDLWLHRQHIGAYLMDFWVVVDYASTLLVVAFYIVWSFIVAEIESSSLRARIKLFAAAVTTVDESGFPVEVDISDDDMLGAVSTLKNIAHLTVALRLIATTSILLLGIRIIGRFHFHPRLHILSQTISGSLTKFGAFFIVSIVVIIMFSMAGHIIFGDRVKEFSTAVNALKSCVNILFGNFDYSVIDGLDGPVSIIYYWAFTIIATLILLNMMLAIVLDTYEQVSEEAFKDTTVTSLWRMSYIVFYDVLLCFYDLPKGVCFSRSRRLSHKALQEDGGSDLVHRDVVFLGRIRPNVLEIVLDSYNIVEAESQESMMLTPETLQGMFSRANISETEARATIDYLQHGLLPVKSEEEIILEEEKKLRQIALLRSRTQRGTFHRPDSTVMVALSPVPGTPIVAVTNPEMKQLQDRMEGLERKLDLVLSRLEHK